MGQISHRLTILLWIAASATLREASTKEKAPLDIYRYLEDSSALKFRQFPCTDQEKKCLEEKTVMHEEDGKCYAVGDQGPCSAGKTFHINKNEAMRRGGHLRGTCDNGCPGVDYAPLAATGECMTRNDVENKICRTEWYLQPALDMFGEWVCEWTRLVCPASKQTACGATIKSPVNGLCSLPDIYTTSYEKVPADHPSDHPLLQYFSKYSVLNCEFPCNNNEEACLRYGRFLSSDGNCYPVSNNLSPNHQLSEEGKFKLTCNRTCVPFEESQIETETCVDYSSITYTVCRNEWGMLGTRDVFGAGTCECLEPQQPSLPPPASTPGYCRTPDFIHPVLPSPKDLTLTVGFKVPCSEEEFACLRKGLVLFDGACYALRTRGPCAENEQLVLDKEALAQVRLQPMCQGPCPEGSVHLPIDGCCFTFAQAISLFCPDNVIALDEFGGWECGYQMDWPAALNNTSRDPNSGTCELPDNGFGGGGGGIGGGGFGTGGGVGR